MSVFIVVNVGKKRSVQKQKKIERLQSFMAITLKNSTTRNTDNPQQLKIIHISLMKCVLSTQKKARKG